MSTCPPVRAATDNDDGLQMTGLQVTYPSNSNNPVVSSGVAAWGGAGEGAAKVFACSR